MRERGCECMCVLGVLMMVCGCGDDDGVCACVYDEVMVDDDGG